MNRSRRAEWYQSILKHKSRLSTFFSLISFTILGFVVISIYSYCLESSRLKSFAVLCLCAFACLALGAIVGFLFGIPRVLQNDAYLARVNEEGSLSDAQLLRDTDIPTEQPYRQQVNTNLEQISDWITKIFVGIGLIQLQNVPRIVNRSSSYIARAFINSQDSTVVASGEVFAAALVIYFPIVGFLIGYILTRLFLALQFGRADVKANS